LETFVKSLFPKKYIDMPTTIYDASQITKRNRDKVIAQQVQQRNAQGKSIITPQAGYAAYVMEEKDNGAITNFRKVGECTNINLACSCFNNTNNMNNTIIGYCPLLTSQESLGNQDIFLQVQVPSACNYSSDTGYTELNIQGNITINWGDGNIESFDSPDELLLLNHTYQFSTSCAQYIIGISGDIITLIPSAAIFSIITQGGGCTGQAYPQLISASFNNVPLLTTLYLNGSTLTSVSGLNNCTSLIDFQLSENNIDYSPIYTFSNLINLGLEGHGNIGTTFNVIGLSSLQTLNLRDNNTLSNIIGLNILVGLTGLCIDGCLFTDINLSSNTNLSELAIGYTLLYNNSTNFLSSLPLLTNLTKLSASGSLFDNTSTIFLLNLPASLIYLNLEFSSFTGIFTIPIQLINLEILNISFMNITSITSLPSNLLELKCVETQLTSLPTIPTSTTSIECSNCNINQVVADNIAVNLVANGFYIDGAYLNIITQSNGTIDITGAIWDSLRSNNWIIE